MDTRQQRSGLWLGAQAAALLLGAAGQGALPVAPAGPLLGMVLFAGAAALFVAAGRALEGVAGQEGGTAEWGGRVWLPPLLLFLSIAAWLQTVRLGLPMNLPPHSYRLALLFWLASIGLFVAATLVQLWRPRRW